MSKVSRTSEAIASIPRKSEARQGYEARPRRSQKNVEAEKTKNSVWLDDVVDDRLAEMARSRRTSKQQLFIEGLDLLFAKYGQPSISELLAKVGKA